MSDANDLLIPLGMPDVDAYVVIDHTDRLIIAATMYSRLLKCVENWKAAVQRMDAINPKMPETVVAEIRNRWLTSLEDWLDARDTFRRLQLSRAEVEGLARDYHRNAGLEEAARLTERWKEHSSAGLRTLAGNIRKLQR